MLKPVSSRFHLSPSKSGVVHGIGSLMNLSGVPLRRGLQLWRRAFGQREASSRTTAPKLAALPEGVRIYTIGDIHGRVDLLDKLHARIDAHRAQRGVRNEIEVYLGDYIDRGHRSREVIDKIIARGRTNRVITLSGNHEMMLLDVLDRPNHLNFWGRNGGLETLMSYGTAVPTRADLANAPALVAEFKKALPPDHLRFFRALTDTFACGDYLFVHAGLRPNIAISDQARQDLFWIREEFLSSTDDFGLVVVHGHTPNESVDFRSNRINIDTGAYITGVLSCLVLEGQAAAVLTS